MAYKRINDSYVNGCRKEYICDTDADFANLPEACTGSTAVSLESGKVYVVSTFGNWIPFGEGYVEKDPNAPLPAGIYVDGVMTASWDELLNEGIITVENGAIAEGDTTYSLSGCKLVIPDDGSVTSIKKEGFYETALDAVIIPDSITSIGYRAFAECSLTYVSIGKGVKRIESLAFNCSLSIKTVKLSEGLLEIGAEAFSECEIEEITIPNSVTSIENNAFDSNYSCKTLVVGSSVVNIGSSAFADCASLESIIFKGTVTQWNAIEKSDGWNDCVPATYVQCTDGQVAL